MILSHFIARVKQAPDLTRDVFVASMIVLSALGGFFIGRISAHEEVARSGITLSGGVPIDNSGDGPGAPLLHMATPETTKKNVLVSQAEPNIPPLSAGMYVGSKSGKTYHLPWCSGAQRIKEENKVYFKDKADAEQRGYKPAANCKGI